MEAKTYIKFREQLKDVTTFVRASSVDLLADVLALQDKYESRLKLTAADWLLLTKRAKDLSRTGDSHYE